MNRITPPKTLTPTIGSLNVASDVFLMGRSAGRVTRQVAKIMFSRSSGRPPPPIPARAPVFLSPGEEKEILVVPLMSAPDSNSWNNMVSEAYCGIQDAVHTCNISKGNLLKLVQHSMCVGLQHSLVPLPFRMPCQLSCAALNKQKGGKANLPETLTRRLMFFMRDTHNR